TATVRMFSSLQARMMRTAISPRFAIRIFSNMWPICFGRRGKGGGRWFPALRQRSSWSNLEQGLTELNRLGVFDQDLSHYAFSFGLDFVHDLHRLDDAHDCFQVYLGADFDIRG